tara:strand:+ start:1737 stop:3662 length:1926 start_codon:yes stop_codon:yes gene_type:complete
MSEQKIYPVPEAFKRQTLMDRQTYDRWYQQSIDDPDTFWAERADQLLDWQTRWDTVSDWDFKEGRAAWFQGGKLNACYNCVDRHLPERAQQTAIIWEGDEPDQEKHITYQELFEQVSRFANALKDRGVKKGDRVVIYMPMIPEAAYAMLACARIGAIHSVVFGGFSPEALKDRIQNAGACALITADEGVRGGKVVALKANADKALSGCDSVHTCLVVERTGGDIDWDDQRDIWYHDALAKADANCEPEWVDSEDPLFTLYTSGSTGKPKGVVHTTAGYLLQSALTHKYVFDYQDGDIYWCTADVGWITGHSYIVYGPLANGATTVMYEGAPNWPDEGRFWQIVQKYGVSIFYTAPTAIRAFIKWGDDWPGQADLSSLRLLGTVGEPINPEAWMWYHRVIGAEKCPIVDTWWQTETGGIMLSPLPGVTVTKPGSCTKPLPGVVPDIVTKEGESLADNQGGLLVLQQPWPSMLRTLYGDHDRFLETYFSEVPGSYFAGDGARRDEDGFYWIMGRVDDVLNVAGHRLSTMEIESALVSHPQVAEAAVVGFPHDLKGEGICCFVTTTVDDNSEEFKAELIGHVREQIGAIATPDQIRFAAAVPKTRSGKIMRRLLRDIAAGRENIGDTTTLEDYAVLAKLREEDE